MGLFSKHHDNGIAEQFQTLLQHATGMTETEFLDSMNIIIRAVEVDPSYSTNEKLKIYELISQISNCLPNERRKYAKKLLKALR